MIFARCWPPGTLRTGSPACSSFVTSGPEATGAKNNISAVDRQPINGIKPRRTMACRRGQAERQVVGRYTVFVRSRQSVIRQPDRAAALVTQVTEFSKVDIRKGLQHDRLHDYVARTLDRPGRTARFATFARASFEEPQRVARILTMEIVSPASAKDCGVFFD